MADEHIKKALHETIKEFGELIEREDELKRQQWELQKKRFKLMAKAHGLVALCEDIPSNSVISRISKNIVNTGLTMAIRNILAGTGEWMSVAQLREQLVRFRIDLARYKNPSSSIHTILTRAVESGEVEHKTDPKTQKALFRTIPPDFLDHKEVSPDMVAEVMLGPRPRKKLGKRTKPKPIRATEPPRLLTEGSPKK